MAKVELLVEFPDFMNMLYISENSVFIPSTATVLNLRLEYSSLQTLRTYWILKSVMFSVCTDVYETVSLKKVT